MCVSLHLLPISTIRESSSWTEITSAFALLKSFPFLLSLPTDIALVGHGGTISSFFAVTSHKPCSAPTGGQSFISFLIPIPPSPSFVMSSITGRISPALMTVEEAAFYSTLDLIPCSPSSSAFIHSFHPRCRQRSSSSMMIIRVLSA